MGKTPHRRATTRALKTLARAIVSPLAAKRYCRAGAVTETLELRRMLSASPVSERAALKKLDSNLISAYQQYQQFSTDQAAAGKLGKVTLPASAFAPSDSLLYTEDGAVLLQAYANGGHTKLLANSLKQLKAQDVAINETEVSALFPISQLGMLATLGDLRFAEPTAYVLNTGSVTSQGDAAVLGPQARAMYNLSGAGVTVGILSDSFSDDASATDTYADDVASGDLPPNVDILSDEPGTDEGRAMAQVIYDTAPGVSFAFATGGTSYATGAANIAALAKAGAKVIVDDLTYENEPFFEDGVMSQEEQTLIAGGVDYISAAGNYGEDSYANAWSSANSYSAGAFSNASGAPYFYGGTSYNFGTASDVNDMDSFQLDSQQSVKISFQWDQPYASVSGGSGCGNQVDIYVLNSANQIVGGSASLVKGKDPIQLFQYTNTSGSTGTYKLMIVSEAGGTGVPGYIKYIDFDGQATNWEYATNSSTIFGHANAAGVESVGAASYTTTPVYNGSGSVPILESYSSEGGTPILFNTSGGRLATAVVRQAPAIVGPDDVYTTFFGAKEGNNPYPTFSGTSAAAATVAGVVALIVQKEPSVTSAQLDSTLASTAIPMQSPVPNFLTGYGFVQATNALTATLGNVTGSVFADYNANGVQDPGEPSLSGVTVYVDENGNGFLEPNDPSTTTNSAGVYTFYNQPTGTAVIRVVAAAGYVPVTASRTVTISAANTSSGINFGLFPNAYTSTAIGTNYTLQVDSTNTSNIDVLINNVLTYTAPISILPELSFSLQGNNSGLTVNFANGNPIPAGGITESALSTATNISLVVNGTSGNDTADINDQTTTFDGSNILASNITNEIINGNGGDDSFTVSAAEPATESLTFNGGVGDNSLTVDDVLPDNGLTTTFNAGTNTLDQNTLTVNAGTFTFAGNPEAQSANLTVNVGSVSGSGENGVVVFAAGAPGSGINQNDLAALNIGDNGQVLTDAPNSHADRMVLVTGTLNISSGGILDLNANDMIITNENLGAIEPLLAGGYNDGTWNGSGIQSSAAALDTTHLTALGSLQNDGSFSSFDGVGNIAGAVLIKYTYYGDANLDGQVDASDYSLIDNGYLTGSTGWQNGDFNYDGVVDGSDYTLIDNAFNIQGPQLS